MQHSSENRRSRLFELLENAVRRGMKPARIRELDGRFSRSRAGFFLKHDVHGLKLDELIHFAREEHERGIHGTYFFMMRDHPDTAKWWSFDEQLDAMREVQELGHEIGIHIDGWQIVQEGRCLLGDAICRSLSEFRDAGLEIVSGNFHGNTRLRVTDHAGHDLQSELLDETARRSQSVIDDLDDDVASVIARHRCRLRDVGIAWWADMHVWSAVHGHIVLPYLTDNWLGRNNELEVILQDRPAKGYKVTTSLPVDPRGYAPADRFVRSRASWVRRWRSPLPETLRLTFNKEVCDQFIGRLAPFPILALVHPQFYETR